MQCTIQKVDIIKKHYFHIETVKRGLPMITTDMQSELVWLLSYSECFIVDDMPEHITLTVRISLVRHLSVKLREKRLKLSA